MKKLLKRFGISLIIILILINIMQINIFAANATNVEIEANTTSSNKNTSSTSSNTNTQANTQTTNSQSTTAQSNSQSTSSTSTNAKSTSSKSKLAGATVDGVEYKDGAKITVENDKETVKVYGVKEGLIHIKVNGTSSSVNVKLDEGENTVVVTDNNGGKVTLYITRKTSNSAGSNNNETNSENTAIDDTKNNETVDASTEPVENAIENTVENVVADDSLKLSKLEIAGITLSPTFNSDTYSYNVTIYMKQKDYKTLSIVATPNKSDATVTIDGNEELNEGENIINIIVKNDEEIKTYQIVVNKTNEEPVATTGNNDNLLNIVLGIVLIAIILVIVILIVKKIKSKKEEENDNTEHLYDYDLYNNNPLEHISTEYKESEERSQIEDIPDITYVEELPERVKENKNDKENKKKKSKGKHS